MSWKETVYREHEKLSYGNFSHTTEISLKTRELTPSQV